MTEARDDQRADPHSAPKADDPIPCGVRKTLFTPRACVLAQQSAETITTVDTAARVAYGFQGGRRWRRRSEAQRSMRPVPIVEVDNATPIVLSFDQFVTSGILWFGRTVATARPHPARRPASPSVFGIVVGSNTWINTMARSTSPMH